MEAGKYQRDLNLKTHGSLISQLSCGLNNLTMQNKKNRKKKINEETKMYLGEGDDKLGTVAEGSLQEEQWLDCRQKQGQPMVENHTAGIGTKERRFLCHSAVLASAVDGHHTVVVGAKWGVGLHLLLEEP